MFTILLTETEDEAESYARAASLVKGDYVVGTVHRLEGIRLTDSDLIAEFHSFKRNPDRSDIEDVLLHALAKGPSKPRWERIGQ